VFHRKIAIKLFGMCWIAVFIAAALFIALLIAHLRNAFGSGANDAQALAWHTLQVTPFSLGGGNSVVLFYASLGFAFASAWDGLAADDPYPKYGAVARAAADARQTFDLDVQAMRQNLTELRDESLESFEKQIRECETKLSRSAVHIDQKEATGARLNQALIDVANSMEALLREFRIENELHRKGVPLPPYFSRKHVLSPLALPSFDTAGDRESLRQQKSLLQTLISREHEIKGKIQLEFEARIKPLESFEQTIAEKEVEV
jgi:hypothetical protein